jgi:iron complex transport system permease protein
VVAGITEDFFRRAKRKRRFLLSLLGLTTLAAVCALTHGAYDITVLKLWHVLIGRASGTGSVVVWQIRLPRIAASLVVGFCMAQAGLLIQTLLRNPLGSPSTLGISHGAAFGASLAIIAFGGRLTSVAGFALLGAMGATGLILLLGRIGKLSADAVILAGVVLGSLFGAATVLLQYLADETRLAMAVVWTFGDLERSDWRQIGMVGAAALLGAIYGFWRRWDFNAIDSGELGAKGLGVEVERLRIEGMLIAALVSSLATAFHGLIAFIGLIAPHMARRLMGSDHRFLGPVTGVLGALLLLSADTRWGAWSSVRGLFR